MANSVSDNDSGSSSTPSLSFQVVISGIKKMYPAVKNISTSEFEELMKTKEGNARLFIVDARPEAEFNVSHIPSAVRIDPQTQDMDGLKIALQDQLLMKDEPASSGDEPIHVVMYCSVGYRSSALAKRFRQALKAEKNEREEASQHPSPSAPPSTVISPSSVKIFNLEGCLFKWANEGRQMVDSQGSPTKFVHPYSLMWGQLISRDIRRWEGPRM